MVYEDTEGSWHTLLDGMYPDEMVADSDGNIWVAYGAYPANDTLALYGTDGAEISRVDPGSVPELGWTDGSTALEIDSYDHLWIASDSVGIIQYAGPGDYTVYNSFDFGGTSVDLTGANVSEILVVNDNLWVALADGKVAVVEDLIGVTAIDEGDQPSVAGEFRLEQNYPNPFNPTTRICFALDQKSNVQLAVYDVLGNLVNVLVTGNIAAGEHSLNWDATDMNGNPVPSGIYLYQLRTGQQNLAKTMLLMR